MCKYPTALGHCIRNLTSDADPEGEEYKVAEKMLWGMLATGSIQEIAHAKNLTNSVWCGTLLDRPENEGKDCAEGTFGELLRFGSVCLKQMRERIEYVQPVVVAEEFVIRKGLLEA
jgi:hypothetical protein